MQVIVAAIQRARDKEKHIDYKIFKIKGCCAEKNPL